MSINVIFFATYYAHDRRRIVHGGYCTKAKRRSLNHGYRHLYVYRGAFMVRTTPSFVRAVILPTSFKILWRRRSTISSRKPGCFTWYTHTPSFVKVSEAVVIVFRNNIPFFRGVFVLLDGKIFRTKCSNVFDTLNTAFIPPLSFSLISVFRRVTWISVVLEVYEFFLDCQQNGRVSK